jgi:hypothetical protein
MCIMTNMGGQGFQQSTASGDIGGLNFTKLVALSMKIVNLGR